MPVSESHDMLAVVKAGPGSENVRLETIPEPIAGPGMARVRVFATGICGTDIHIARDEYAHETPVVMGHEILGVVESTGDDGDGHLIGQRVVCETYFFTCGVCDWCRAGRPNLCPSRRLSDRARSRMAASLHFLVVPVKNLHPLPEWVGEIEGDAVRTSLPALRNACSIRR